MKNLLTKTFGNGLVLLCYQPEEKIPSDNGAVMKFRQSEYP